MATMAELTSPVTADQQKAKLIANLQKRGLPTSDWGSGSPDRNWLEMFAESLADQSQLVPSIASGGFVLLAAELGLTEWVRLAAKQVYNVDYHVATFTEGNVLLTAATGVGPTNFNAGDLAVVTPLGNIYRNVNAGVIPLSGSLSALFRSESPNDSANGRNYVDGNGTISQFLIGPPGITPSNPAPDFSPVNHVGPGTGTVIPTTGGSPVASVVDVRIDATGDIGVATYSYRLDGGSYVSGGFVPASFAIPGRNITLNFANGAGTPNSFLKDDTYSFVSPGSWITQQGTDVEADLALAQRCIGRWPLLSLVPTEDAYATMARNASSSVKQVRVSPSSTVPGGVDVIIATQAGGAAPAVVTAVQDYINQRTLLTDRPLVQSATVLAVTLSGTVYVKIANLTQAQSEAQTNVAGSVLQAGIGGTYFLAQVAEDIMRGTGVVNAKDLKINGVAADLVFSTTQVGSFTQVLSTGLTWIAI